MQATSLMQKYAKTAEIYQLPREGRFLVKNDHDVVSNSKIKSKIMAAEKLYRMIKSYDFIIMAKFLKTTL